MKPAATWRYADRDECARFFTHCLHAQNPDLPEQASVLEIGCAEFDWLALAEKAWPSFTLHGLDWRKYRGNAARAIVRHGDAMDRSLYPPNSFDWIVSISAIEHVGLGHYAKDPVSEQGDSVTIDNAALWLKPGGWLYFDVPYDPSGYAVVGTKHRQYDDEALWQRVDHTAASTRYYAKARGDSALIDKPTEPLGKGQYYYVGVWWQKPNSPERQ